MHLRATATCSSGCCKRFKETSTALTMLFGPVLRARDMVPALIVATCLLASSSTFLDAPHSHQFCFLLAVADSYKFLLLSAFQFKLP